MVFITLAGSGWREGKLDKCHIWFGPQSIPFPSSPQKINCCYQHCPGPLFTLGKGECKIHLHTWFLAQPASMHMCLDLMTYLEKGVEGKGLCH